MWATRLSRNAIRRRMQSTTADEFEINKFQKLSDKWWDDVKILLSMNQIRVPFIRDGLINTGLVIESNIESAKPLQGLNILDVGCGGGFLSESLARIGANVTGIDICEDLIIVANKHKQNDAEIRKHLTYKLSCIEDFSSTNQMQFDAIVSSEVIEHVSDKSVFVKNCVDCLKPGGSIFMTTINKTAWANLFAICIAENFIKIVPRDTHDYEKFISPHTLQRMLEEHGCFTRRIHGIFYNPLTKTFHWTCFDKINYAIQAIKTN